MPVCCRWLLVVLLGLFSAGAGAASWSEEQLKDLYFELLAWNTGLEYQFDVARFENCGDATALLEKVASAKPGLQARSLRQITRVKQMPFRPLPVVWPELRNSLQLLSKGEKTGAVKMADGACLVAELTETRPVKTPSFAQMKEFLPGFVEQGLLPTPEQLRQDPVLRNRSLANNTRTAEAVADLPADFDINTRQSNLGTILNRALLVENAAMVKAALARGANPNLCQPWLCPLHLALRWKNGQESREIVKALLQAGADPNQYDQAMKAELSPLSAAILNKGLPEMELLVAAGAQVNPSSPRITPPLFFAAETGKRELVDYLIGKGADVNARDPNQFAWNRLADAAAASKNKEFQDWLEKRLIDLARASGDYRWEGWIEQNGKRTSLAQREIHLKRAPFRIIARLQEKQKLFVVSSEGDELQKKLTAGHSDNFIFHGPAVWGAEEQDGTSESLFLNRAGLGASDIGMTQIWFWNAADERRFQSRSASGDEYLRTISSLLYDDNGGKTMEIPVQKYKGRAIYLIVDSPLVLSNVIQRFMYPRLVRLVFD
jgi:hypothetical protein